jgi:hypothetical protein
LWIESKLVGILYHYLRHKAGEERKIRVVLKILFVWPNEAAARINELHSEESTNCLYDMAVLLIWRQDEYLKTAKACIEQAFFIVFKL